MGGWTAITYTLKNPGNVKAVVMASTSGTIDFNKVKNIDIEKLKLWEQWSQNEIVNFKRERYFKCNRQKDDGM